MAWAWSVAAVLAGYLVGSLSFAVIVSRAMGLADPRSYGSGNPGATNVLRSGKRSAAVLTLALDALKGYAPVLAALWLAPRLGWGAGTVAAVGLAAFLGHVWPVFFHFKGGKGVATAAGVLLAFNPWLGVATLVTWVIVARALLLLRLDMPDVLTGWGPVDCIRKPARKRFTDPATVPQRLSTAKAARLSPDHTPKFA